MNHHKGGRVIIVVKKCYCKTLLIFVKISKKSRIIQFWKNFICSAIIARNRDFSNKKNNQKQKVFGKRVRQGSQSDYWCLNCNPFEDNSLENVVLISILEPNLVIFESETGPKFSVIKSLQWSQGNHICFNRDPLEKYCSNPQILENKNMRFSTIFAKNFDCFFIF